MLRNVEGCRLFNLLITSKFHDCLRNHEHDRDIELDRKPTANISSAGRTHHESRLIYYVFWLIWTLYILQ